MPDSTDFAAPLVIAAALAVAACDSQTRAPAPAPDIALRDAVDAATEAYYRCIDETAAAQATAAPDQPVATLVVIAERECEAGRKLLFDAIVTLKRAETPTLSQAELEQIASTSIKAYAPEIRERAAAALLTSTGPQTTAPDATTGPDANAAN
jgi:hypothetical protein